MVLWTFLFRLSSLISALQRHCEIITEGDTFNLYLSSSPRLALSAPASGLCSNLRTMVLHLLFQNKSIKTGWMQSLNQSRG
ncbi:hypothetical protein PBY51_025067 [Eleginops maclovinus]|uniref:Secreted protein n=1 Tax=Eleginops maclovinus TaxID=56733 RepID=A0AAN8AVG9_ELEMC|nr:hypothetical protein PBY51_025067 [Eleginops maclovinus]